MSHQAHIDAIAAACQAAGLNRDRARFYALMAASEALLNASVAKLTAATFADTAEYRSADEREADRMRRMALHLREQADAIHD